MKPSSLDIVFLSYKEPNADANYADLCTKLRKEVKRVHGISGIDTAHKAAAQLSTSSSFLLVDGDTVLDDISFMQMDFDLEYKFEYKTLSFNSINSVNGLVYGNGGLKIWNRARALSMNTHENSETQEKLEFCFNDWYVQMPGCYSTTTINSTAEQAFFAGFREGVKLSTNHGVRSTTSLNISSYSLLKLKTWMSVGADAEFGRYAIHGARQGFYNAAFNGKFDINCVSNYEVLSEYFHDYIKNTNPTAEERLKKRINESFPSLCIDMSPELSSFFKGSTSRPMVIKRNPNLTDQEVRNL